ncbi:hypothetical protein L3Q82_017721 [Scortum barcoo]|uniref:Uncharacterized protein n=1 Tax=Scortum barcoo TaxID=214431 RepID=A0ACB8VLL8_9TELE|nr:hypothetical protein L3Q82_017721 [Scortum barcoo]
MLDKESRLRISLENRRGCVGPAGTGLCWERLAEPSVREVFNSHLWENFSQISRDAGDIESEWTPQKGEAVLCQHCLQCGWGAVDLNWGYLPRISSIPPSTEEAEAGDSEVDSSITQAEVTDVVHKLLGGNARRGWMRSSWSTSSPLDVVGLSWLTHASAALHGGWGQYRWSGKPGWWSLFLKRGSNYWGITLLSLPEAMVLDQKRVVCHLRVGGEVLPQVEEFKYLGVLFTSEGKIDRQIDRRIGAASAVMRWVYQTIMVKKEGSRKAKLSIYQSVYAPTLTYGHELWVMTRKDKIADTSSRNEGGWALP